MIQAIAAVAVVLLIAVVSLVIWVSASRKKQVQAEVATKALTGAQEFQREGNKVMAEPVADELAWIDAARERMRNDSNQS